MRSSSPRASARTLRQSERPSASGLRSSAWKRMRSATAPPSRTWTSPRPRAACASWSCVPAKSSSRLAPRVPSSPPLSAAMERRPARLPEPEDPQERQEEQDPGGYVDRIAVEVSDPIGQRSQAGHEANGARALLGRLARGHVRLIVVVVVAEAAAELAADL